MSDLRKMGLFLAILFIPLFLKLTYAINYWVALILVTATLSLLSLFVMFRKARAKSRALAITHLDRIEKFLSDNDKLHKDKSFVLLLRPFGMDGLVDEYSARDFINQRLDATTAEEKICEKIESLFNTQVIALANQQLSKVPDSPTYFLCSNDNWKWHVELLIQRCLFTVLYIPSNTTIRSSLKWELFTAICSGLRSRILVLYPGHWLNAKNIVVDKIKKEFSYIANIAMLEERSIGFIMKDGLICKQFVLTRNEGIKALVKPTDYSSTKILEVFMFDMLHQMLTHINEIPKANLNMFRDSELLDLDFDLTAQEMKIIYESKESIFETFHL